MTAGLHGQREQRPAVVRIHVDGTLEVFDGAVAIAAVEQDAAHLIGVLRQAGPFSTGAPDLLLGLLELARHPKFAGLSQTRLDRAVAQLRSLFELLGRLVVLLHRRVSLAGIETTEAVLAFRQQFNGLLRLTEIELADADADLQRRIAADFGLHCFDSATEFARSGAGDAAQHPADFIVTKHRATQGGVDVNRCGGQRSGLWIYGRRDNAHRSLFGISQSEGNLSHLRAGPNPTKTPERNGIIARASNENSEV